MPALSKNKYAVLITYGWCRTSYVAAKSLYQSGYNVYTCSHLSPSMSSWSRFVRSSSLVPDPFSTPEEFVRRIAYLIDLWSIDIILPGHEDALALRAYQNILPRDVLLACPQYYVLKNALNKAWITKHANAHGVDIPFTVFPKSLSEALSVSCDVGFPLVVKLPNSNSAKGVVIARSQVELKRILSDKLFVFNKDSADDNPYLQRYSEGGVVGGCFMARDGEILGFFGERYLRVKSGEFGTSVFRVPYFSDELKNQVEKMVHSLRWSGIGHFDFIEDNQKKTLVLLEMNPRLWGALNLAYVNGQDFIGALVADALGEIDIAKYFSAISLDGCRSMWIVGELIRFFDLIANKNYTAVLQTPKDIVFSLKNTSFDDFVWSDPLPIFAEAVCYAKTFMRSGGKINP